MISRFLPTLCLCLCAITAAAQAPEIPHLRKQGTATQLVVDGRPFLIRGGELGNSSASNLEYLAPHLIDVWRAGAPAIDFLAPDIYFPTFIEWTRRYVRSGNPLFIPEALRSPDAAVNGLYAFAAYDAIGFSPFAIESINEPAASLLTARPAAAAARAPMPAGGLVIATAPDEFLFAGIGVTATFASTDPSRQTGILSVEEGKFVNGQWQNIRWLNGDQTHQGRHLRLEPGRFTIQRIKLYRYR